MSCLFCRDHRTLAEAGEIVFETDLCTVTLHSDWAVRGHAMIISKKHVENISEFTDDEAAHFTSVHRAAEAVLLELTGAERAILLKLGIQVAHLHLHIYPMHATDDRSAVMAAIDGKTRVERDPGFVDAVRRKLPLAFSS